MAIEVVTHLVAGETMEVVVIDLWAKMNASSVGAQDIGPETALQLVVEEVVGLVHSPHILGLGLVDVGIALVIMIATWMTVMMEGAMETGIALTAGRTNMGAVIAMSVTGTQLVIVLLVIDMAVLIVILKMDMAKTEAMIGMVEQEVAVIDMEGEARQETMEVIVAGQALMTAQVGEGARLPLTATNV